VVHQKVKETAAQQPKQHQVAITATETTAGKACSMASIKAAAAEAEELEPWEQPQL
jgi:hypothetical protein